MNKPKKFPANSFMINWRCYRFLRIESPAGVGKTVVMLSKIINIILNGPSSRYIQISEDQTKMDTCNY